MNWNKISQQLNILRHTPSNNNAVKWVFKHNSEEDLFLKNLIIIIQKYDDKLVETVQGLRHSFTS